MPHITITRAATRANLLDVIKVPNAEGVNKFSYKSITLKIHIVIIVILNKYINPKVLFNIMFLLKRMSNIMWCNSYLNTGIGVRILCIFMGLSLVPVSSAVEERGTIASIEQGESLIMDGASFPGFYYSASSGTHYETLMLNFTKDGVVDVGDASYIL